MLQSGCGTLTGGFFYNVPLRSSEPGTRVRVYKDGKLDKTVIAPYTETLFPLTTEKVWFEFHKDGFEPQSESRWRTTNQFSDKGNAIFMIGLFIAAIPPYLLDWMTGAQYEFDTKPICAIMTKTPEDVNFERAVPKIETANDVIRLAAKHNIKTKISPDYKEWYITPLSRSILVGTWQMNSHSDVIQEYVRSGKGETVSHSFNTLESWDFKDDGTYTATTVSGKNASTIKGTWMYSDGILTYVPDNNKVPQVRKIGWMTDDMITIDWKSEVECKAYWNVFAHGHNMYSGDPRFANQRRERISYGKDCFGCKWLSITYIGYNGWQIEKSIQSPQHYRRVSGNRLPKSASYRIINCERESGSDFAYKFTIELGKDSDQTLAAFRKIQKEFRSAIQADYLESFPNADKNALHIDFPDYKLNERRVEGRAVVLTISATSLTYDQNTRKGKLAVRVNANQYEEARKWIRKNIETLARDKNIVLTTGEIPPAAKFYLGHEDFKGNILEIEFMTE